MLAGSKRSRSQELGLHLSSATPASSSTPTDGFSLPSGGGNGAGGSGSGGNGGTGTGGAAGDGNGNGGANGSANQGTTGGQQGAGLQIPSLLRAMSLHHLQRSRISAHLMCGSILPRRKWSLRTMGGHMNRFGLIAISQNASTRLDVRAIMEQQDFGPI